MTPMLIAASKEYWDIVEMFLAHPNINVNLRDEHETSLFLLALQGNQVELASRLADDPNLEVNIPFEHKNGLMEAVQLGHFQIVKKLVEN